MKPVNDFNPVKLIIFDMFFPTYRIVAAFFIGSLLFSCTEKEQSGVPPVVILLEEEGLIWQDTTIAPGQLLHIGIHAKAGDFPITQFQLRVISDSVQVYYDTGMYVQELTWKGSFSKSFNDNEVWEFMVRDRFSQSHRVSLNIANDTMPAFGLVELHEQVKLGGQSNNSLGGFYSLKDQSVYFAKEAKDHQEIIEMVYYYYSEDEHVIGAPGSNIEEDVFGPENTPVNWDYRNTTRYMPAAITSEQFDAIENDSLLLVSYIEGEGKRKAKNLVSGAIYSFKTQESKFGMFRVNAVTGADLGDIEIDIKIQK